jgi:hypothetical protein
MKFFFLSIGISLAASAASARPCGANDGRLISESLKARSVSASLSEAERSKAAFAENLISNEPKLKCNVESGIAGNSYEIGLSTHGISINYLGSSISQVQIQRIGFN